MKKETLLKIKALAERGIGGEKLTAQAQLVKLMKKYKITAEELDIKTVEDYYFYFDNKFMRKLLHQIIYLVVGKDIRSIRIIYFRKIKKVKAELTKLQFIEIDALYSHYRKAFRAQQELFILAFIQANNIYPAGIYADAKDGLTAADIQTAAIAAGLDKTPFIKQIAGGKK